MRLRNACPDSSVTKKKKKKKEQKQIDVDLEKYQL